MDYCHYNPFWVLCQQKNTIWIFIIERLKMVNINEVFSKRLKEERIKNGFTQAEIAQKLEASQGAYQKWESGAREPNFQTLLKIASILNTTTSYLLGESNVSAGRGTEEFDKLVNAPYFHWTEMAINESKDLVRAISYIAKKKGIKEEDYFNMLIQNLSGNAKNYLKSVYYTEILQQSLPLDNNPEKQK